MINTLLRIGHSRIAINDMSWGEVVAYTEAYEADEAEKLVLLMNCTAVAYGGTAKDRKNMAKAILGLDTTFDAEQFETIFAAGSLATPPEAQSEMKTWALEEFDPDDKAFKPVK